jgi:hypothetical protein
MYAIRYAFYAQMMCIHARCSPTLSKPSLLLLYERDDKDTGDCNVKRIGPRIDLDFPTRAELFECRSGTNHNADIEYVELQFMPTIGNQTSVEDRMGPWNAGGV